VAHSTGRPPRLTTVTRYGTRTAPIIDAIASVVVTHAMSSSSAPS
jgi:hypothetical protein